MAANDRAIQFGDGCFTTARIDGKGSLRYRTPICSVYYRMLVKNYISHLTSGLTLEQEMQTLARQHAQGVLKGDLTAALRGRGYSTALRVAHAHSLLSLIRRIMRAGVTRGLLDAKSGALGRNSWLAGLKHLNRLEQVLIRSHLEQTDADEALVLDSDGWLTECCAANLFWRQGRDVFTPRLDYAGVNGIMRQFCIRSWHHRRFALSK